ncbi:MAG: acylphosphatase [Acidobacteria bacterium]|nr:MAG: acylphosphatase [Acidobacteriota bacterium]
MERRTVRARIEGRVQGVWYRAWTVERARELGLVGWVRNRSDGSVEALFSGPREAVERMLELCRQGPPAAEVTAVKAEPAENEPLPEGFHQRPTL